MTYEKELKKACEFGGADVNCLKDVLITDYAKQSLDGKTGDLRIIQHAINCTVDAVHQAMEGFIHNMNSIHSRGGRIGCPVYVQT